MHSFLGGSVLVDSGRSLPARRAQFLLLLGKMKEIKDRAADEATKRYPTEGTDWGGRRDAFRHAYWNMMMADEFGTKFAYDFTTAHERQTDATDLQEAMDLYNNEMGRLAAAICTDAYADPHAPQYIQHLVDSGEMLAITESQRLVPSNHKLDDNPGTMGYFYDTANEPRERQSGGAHPGWVPCIERGGRCADR